jgi:tRNA A37 N6-isopentenylltransferase MiaA
LALRLRLERELVSGSSFQNEIPDQVRNDKTKTFAMTKQEDRNDKEFNEMKQKMKFAIHSYARRQLTWFRRFPKIVWFKDLESASKLIKTYSS